MNKWSHVFVTYDGSAKPEGLRLYIDGRNVPVDVETNSLTGSLKNNVDFTIGRRTNSNVFKGKIDDPMFFRKALSGAEVVKVMNAHAAQRLLAIPDSNRTHDQNKELSRLYLAENSKRFEDLNDQIRATNDRKSAVLANVSTVMIMQEMEKPRDCFVLTRGQYDKHGEQVTAGLPGFLPPMPKGAPNNRLGLAEWIVSPENPLTPRVTVNRLWERFFGVGIVATSEDMGTRAEFPSHPELLDYLATELIRLKWNLKAMIKEIVMSATYRQASLQNAEGERVDPQNRLLWRGARFRLPAETIRDQALFAAGLLVEKLGGPSVRPYQPEGIWDETNVYGNLRNYKHDMGDGLYRRSLYTIWKRTAAPPEMTTFDVPARETCRVKRARTNTPLQALTLLNDETFVEAARVLAQRMIREGGTTPQSRIAYGFSLLLARNPSQQELDILLPGVLRRIDYYKRNPNDAIALLSIGEKLPDMNINFAELAAYTVTASALLNLDETVTKE
jgi:hypothetical protein